MISWIRAKILLELFGESADLIVSEFIRLFAGEAFEVVFCEVWTAGACKEGSEVN